MKSIKDTRAPVLKLQRFSLHDGPGIRTTVFFKGCPLSCAWCSNPESRDAAPQVLYFRELCTGCGACAGACPQAAIAADDYSIDRARCVACGRCASACVFGAKQLLGSSMSVGEVLNVCLSDRKFYEHSGGGVTLSGGEPALYAEFAIALMDSLRAQGVSTAFETCGYADADQTVDMAKHSDLVLFDLKTDDAEIAQKQLHRDVRQALRLLKRLAGMHGNLTVRFAMIPGVNDAPGAIARYCQTLSELCPNAPVELLPFHRLATEKYRALDRRYSFENTALLSAEQIEMAEAAFRHHGIAVKTLY